MDNQPQVTPMTAERVIESLKVVERVLSDCEVSHTFLIPLRRSMRLVKHCADFIKDNEIGDSETVHQYDHVIEKAYEFIEGVCDIVGYHPCDD